MTLVLVEVPDEAAVEALRRQHGVRVVGVVAAAAEAPVPPAVPPRKWAGALAAIATTSGEEWDKHLHDIRNEWEREL